MKLSKALLTGLLLSSVSLDAARDTGNISSTVLGRDVPYAIVTPSYYKFPSEQDKIYPVLYGLHGSGGDENAFTTLNKLQAEIELKYPAVVASFSRQGGGDMNRFFWEEFVPFVETNYRAGGSPGKRALFGFSAGGGMSNSLMVEKPDFFSSVAMLAGGTNQNGIANHINNGVELPPMYFICGENDTQSRVDGVNEMSDFLTAEGIYHEAWIVENEGHTWELINNTSPTIIEWQYQYFVEPPDDSLWRGEYEIIEEHFADTGDFLGMLYIENDPWVYAYDLSAWVYLQEGTIDAGLWTWVQAE